MDFNKLYKVCLSRKTSFKDRGTGVEVSIKPAKGEKICFFPVDDKTKNPECYFRNAMKIKAETCCDLIIFYENQGRQILCLVELKGADVIHAADQILNVCSKLQPQMKNPFKINAKEKPYFLLLT